MIEPAGWLALGILLVAAVLFLTKWLPLEVTALGIPVALFVTGVLKDPGVVLAGFGNPAVIAIAAIFVIGAALEETGVARYMARIIERLAGQNERRLIILITACVATLSAFMSNAATVAVLIPTVVALGQRIGRPPSRLLLPLAFGAILGGNLTLIGTSSNILLGDRLRAYEGSEFGMFDFALAGVPIVVAGIAFLALIGPRLLPSHDPRARFRASRMPEELASSYGVRDKLYQVRITSSSPLCGKTIADCGFAQRYSLTIVMLMRTRGFRTLLLEPRSDLTLQNGDVMYLEGREEDALLLTLEERIPLEPPDPRHVAEILKRGMTFAEVVLSPHSRNVGKTLRELDFRSNHGLSVLAVWRAGEPLSERLADLPIQFGDALLVSGLARRVHELALDPDYLVVSEPTPIAKPGRAPLAVLLLLVAVVPKMFGVELAVSALASAILMVATGCVRLESVQRVIDWKVLFLIIGTLPLGTALEQHRVAAVAGEALIQATGSAGTPVLLSVLFLGAALISITSSNAAAAVILAPIAHHASQLALVDLRQCLLAVAYGCSCAFVVPFAHQCNLMVMGPGGYRTSDFLRLGSWMSLVVALVAIAVLSLTGS